MPRRGEQLAASGKLSAALLLLTVLLVEGALSSSSELPGKLDRVRRPLLLLTTLPPPPGPAAGEPPAATPSASACQLASGQPDCGSLASSSFELLPMLAGRAGVAATR